MEQKYSVLMSLYKKENPEYLRIAIESMLNQTVKPDEIILVEDGPLTEELYDILKDYKEHLKLVINEKNMGLGLALQRGLEACRNELVARMDTDDISVDDRCEKQLNYLYKNPDASIVGGQITEFIDSEDNIVGKRIVPLEDSEIKLYLKKRCPFNHMTVMFRKSEVLKAGNYQDFNFNEDYYLWLRMYLNGCKFANLSDVLVNVRVGQEMYQRRGGWIYFKSERKIQNFMFHNRIIGLGNWIVNVVVRFIVQCVLTNRLRGFFYKIFAREKN